MWRDPPRPRPALPEARPVDRCQEDPWRTMAAHRAVRREALVRAAPHREALHAVLGREGRLEALLEDPCRLEALHEAAACRRGRFYDEISRFF